MARQDVIFLEESLKAAIVFNLMRTLEEPTQQSVFFFQIRRNVIRG